jgi:hypothetical protein
MSKTVIFNAVSLVVGFATYLLDNEFIQSNPDLVAVIGAGVAIGNIVLRYFTKTPMTGWLKRNVK